MEKYKQYEKENHVSGVVAGVLLASHFINLLSTSYVNTEILWHFLENGAL